jgi:hypothetical protein
VVEVFDMRTDPAADIAAGLRKAESILTLATTSVDYVIGDDERALRNGRWTPENARELLMAIDDLRHVIATEAPRETVACAALRVGRLHTEAVAKSQWPIVKAGRKLRHEKQAASAERGKAISTKAAVGRAEALKLKGQHDAEEHGALVPWLAKRMKCSEKTIRRYLGQQRR